MTSSIPDPATDPLFALLRPQRLTSVIDVGANPHDGGKPFYTPLLSKGLCRIIGFEPHQQAFVALKAKQGPLETYLPFAVGDGKEHTLYICQSSGMSSLLRPDTQKLAQFPVFPRWGKIMSEEQIETRSLDDISEIIYCDFLKLDIQGGELIVLQAAPKRLADIVAIHIEVSFITLYENQPTFAEIDIELRKRGFVPHMIADLTRRLISPMYIQNNPSAGLNQLLQADLVYVKDFADMGALSTEQVKHLALIAHHCYKSYDLSFRCLFELVERKALNASTKNEYQRLMV
jgi:FkbM family methyltransferase